MGFGRCLTGGKAVLEGIRIVWDDLRRSWEPQGAIAGLHWGVRYLDSTELAPACMVAEFMNGPMGFFVPG